MTPDEAQSNFGQLAIRKHKKLRCRWDGSGYSRGRYPTYDMGKLVDHTEVLKLLFEMVPIGYPFHKPLTDLFQALHIQHKLLTDVDPVLQKEPESDRPAIVADRWSIMMKHTAELKRDHKNCDTQFAELNEVLQLVEEPIRKPKLNDAQPASTVKATVDNDDDDDEYDHNDGGSDAGDGGAGGTVDGDINLVENFLSSGSTEVHHAATRDDDDEVTFTTYKCGCAACNIVDLRCNMGIDEAAEKALHVDPAKNVKGKPAGQKFQAMKRPAADDTGKKAIGEKAIGSKKRRLFAKTPATKKAKSVVERTSDDDSITPPVHLHKRCYGGKVVHKMYILDTNKKYIVAASAIDFENIEDTFTRVKTACDAGELTTKQEVFAFIAAEEVEKATDED